MCVAWWTWWCYVGWTSTYTIWSILWVAVDVGSKDSTQNWLQSRSITFMFLRISATGSLTSRNHGTSEWLSTPWTLGGGGCLFPFFLWGLFAFFFFLGDVTVLSFSLGDVTTVLSFFLGDVTVLAFFLGDVTVLAFFLANVTMVEFFLVDRYGFFDSGLSLMGCLSHVVRSRWVSLHHVCLFTEGDVMGESVPETMHVVQCFFCQNDFTGVLVHGGVLECSITKPFLFDVTADRIFKSPYIRCEESGRFCGSSWHVWI